MLGNINNIPPAHVSTFYSSTTVFFYPLILFFGCLQHATMSSGKRISSWRQGAGGTWNLHIQSQKKLEHSRLTPPPSLPPKKGNFPTSYVKNILIQVIYYIFQVSTCDDASPHIHTRPRLRCTTNGSCISY
jgi:hypothetical protein